jgi:hypothetical protein
MMADSPMKRLLCAKRNKFKEKSTINTTQTMLMLFYYDDHNTDTAKIKSLVKYNFADYSHFDMMKLSDKKF